jgi:hypothetical protein
VPFYHLVLILLEPVAKILELGRFKVSQLWPFIGAYRNHIHDSIEAEVTPVVV